MSSGSLASRIDIHLLTTLLRRYPFVSLVVTLASFRMLFSTPRRSRKLHQTEERVVILGASGGIGRAIALKYASTGARVCIVARREHELAKVAEECRAVAQNTKKAITDYDPVLHVQGDFTVVEDMVNLRAKVQEAWNGLDTLVVCAGVPTFLPFCELSGLEAHGSTFTPAQADQAAIERAIDTINSVTRTNYIGPAIAAATFIPALVSSKAPSIVLMSSLAALLPAPTISLYNASKAAALGLYRSLAIENPSIAFTYILPSTVKGDAFFQSAADGGKVRGVDPNSYGITQETVASRVVDAVDKGEGEVFLPGTGSVAYLISFFFPSFIAKVARKRYGYPPVN